MNKKPGYLTSSQTNINPTFITATEPLRTQKNSLLLLAKQLVRPALLLLLGFGRRRLLQIRGINRLLRRGAPSLVRIDDVSGAAAACVDGAMARATSDTVNRTGWLASALLERERVTDRAMQQAAKKKCGVAGQVSR